MNTIRLDVSGKVFLLNNNDKKFDRAVEEAGPDASAFEILAYYDKLQGLMQDESGRNLENGQFWDQYKKQRVLVDLYQRNEESLREAETHIYPLLNENVSQKRIFLGTLLTIATAIVAALFFLFSKDSIPAGHAQLLAKTSGTLYAAFIVLSSGWLIAILSQESLKLDGQINFYKKVSREFMESAGKAIRDEEDFKNFQNQKIEEAKEIEAKKIFAGHETWFIAISTLFILASVPIIILFWIA